MQEKRTFKSIYYYQCVIDLAHCDLYGFDKKPVFNKFKKRGISRKKINMIYDWKKNHKSKWKFFQKHVNILNHRRINWKKLTIEEKNDITEYMDFFVYRYDGLAFRWDGIGEFKDRKGRSLIKTFSGVNKLVNKIIYATRPLNGFFYSYKRMKTLKVISKNGSRNVMELSAKKQLSIRQKRV